MRKKKKNFFHFKSLMVGFIAGLVTFLLLSSVILGFISQEGVVVYINSEEVASTVEKQVTAFTNQQIPYYMGEAKEEVPGIVEKQLEGQFTTGKLEIAGVSFELPEEFVSNLEHMLKDNIEAGIYNIIDGIDNEELSRDLGAYSYKIVKKTLEEEYKGKSLTVKPFEWFSILVTIDIEDSLEEE